MRSGRRPGFRTLVIIITAGLAVIIAAGTIQWWFEATAGQRAEETARSACAAAIREAGGDPGALRLSGSGRIDGRAGMFWFGGAKISDRAVTCRTYGINRADWIANVSLNYPDGTPVKGR